MFLLVKLNDNFEGHEDIAYFCGQSVTTVLGTVIDNYQ